MNRAHSFRLAVCPPLLALALVVPSHAAVIYVNRNATGATHDGTSWGTAFSSIQAGINAASTGDEVWVAEGVYYELPRLYYPSMYGGFTGTETARSQRDWRNHLTIIDGQGTTSQPVMTVAFSGRVLDGFTVRNGYTGLTENTSVTISNCTVSGTTYGITVGGGLVTVVNCTFIANYYALEVNSYPQAGSAAVSNSTFSGNAYAVYNGSTLSIENCTLSANNNGIDVDYGDAKISNCIVAFNGTGITGYNAHSITNAHNDTFGSTFANYKGIPDPTGMNGNISLDPRLSNAYHDFHIQPDSPCVDAGDNSGVQPAWVDLDGQPRIMGARVDIGSDESDGSTWHILPRTWYVSQSGDDGNDGTSWGKAKKTVMGALAIALGTDEIWVKAGTYHEAVSIPAGVGLYGGFAGTETASTQREWGANVTTLINSNGDVVRSMFHGAVIDGFTVRGGLTNSGSCVIVYGTAAVSHCALSDNGCGVSADYGSAVVTDCTISGCINGVGSSSGAANVTNCTLSGNETGITSSDSVTTVSNCIVAYNWTGISGNTTYGSGVVTLSHNDVYGNTAANYSVIADQTGLHGSISQDPGLSNRFHDLHIQPGSPCIDAGDDSVVPAGAIDIDGQPRIIGAHVDIGADESDSTLWTVPSHIWYVAKTGSDANDGTSWAKAKQTVGGALMVAEGTDEVWVAKGSYAESISLRSGVPLYGGFAGTETERSQRDLRSNPSVLVGNGTLSATLVESFFTGDVFDGFTVRNQGAGIMTYGTASVTNCALSGIGVAVQVIDGEADIANCTVTGPSNYGVLVEGGVIRLTNCSIQANSVGVSAYSSTSQVHLINTIVAFNDTGVSRNATSSVVIVSHCDVFGSSTADYTGMVSPLGTNGNISADPLFVNGYHLGPGSPCIDAGDDSVLIPGTTDLDGNPRKLGAHVDIGAYEFLTPGYYSLADAAKALQIVAGMTIASATDRGHLDIFPTVHDGHITVADAVAVARKVAGLDANP